MFTEEVKAQNKKKKKKEKPDLDQDSLKEISSWNAQIHVSINSILLTLPAFFLSLTTEKT